MELKLTTIIVIIFAFGSCTQTSKTEISEPEKLTIKFFKDYSANGPIATLGPFLTTNKYISKSIGDSVAIKLERLTKGMGKFQGIEKIRERKYGSTITMLTYLVKYDQQPIRFNFKFYQTGDGWRIQDFSYESEFLDEMNETVKPYRLKENLEDD